jgi:hypothetical protein
MKSMAGAMLAGLALAGLPFFQSGFAERGAHGALHMDHQPHHGGRLLMLGNHHLEILERDETLELYVSDAERRPLRPGNATIAFDGAAAVPMKWSGYRMTAPLPARYAEAEYRIALTGAPPLTIRLPR